MKRGRLLPVSIVAGLALGMVSLLNGSAFAVAPSGDFNLQVTPSPLVATIKPGVKTQLQLKIRNSGTAAEDLKIEPRSFTFNSASGQVHLDDTAPAAISSWLSFSEPKFTIQSGQWFSEDITLNTPKTAGFSYSFALVISRQSEPTPTSGGRVIKGSLAVFTLINIDRPGANSSLQVVSFTSSRKLYEYLPATLDVRFRNNGNTITQPYGNIFIQRTATTKSPLAALTVNSGKSYILPGTERTVSAQWDDGFAMYQAAAQPDGTTAEHLSVDWSKLSHFRIGRYTAKLVAVYNDGNHDVPIEGTVSFWVIPWRAILLFLVIVCGLWFLARWRGKRRTEKAVRKALATQAEAHKRAAEKKETDHV